MEIKRKRSRKPEMEMNGEKIAKKQISQKTQPKSERSNIRSQAGAWLLAKHLIAWILILTMTLSMPTQILVDAGYVVETEAAVKRNPVLNRTSFTTNIGRKSKLTLNNASSSKVVWSSENADIVTVSRTGYIVGINAGTANVYATYNGKQYTCKVTVLKPKLSYDSISIYVGNRTSIKLNNCYGSIKWTTADKTIATVSSGKIRGIKEGTTTITALNQGKSYNCTVKVIDLNKKINNAIDALIQTARNEIGYCEKRTNRNLDSKTANAGYNNYTKYARDVDSFYQGDPWCAMFISWCMQKTYGLSKSKKLLVDWPYVACRYLPSNLKSYSTPRKGDIVLFYDGSGYNHTGLVTKVQGTRFWTIEGNTKKVNEVVPEGYCVCEKSYYVRSLPKVKFCRPNYVLAV